MERRGFLKGLGGLLATIPLWSPAAVRPRRREVLIQRSPMAGFQYHQGEAVWGRLLVGDRLDLVREPQNPHDALAVAICWQGAMLGYVPRAQNEVVAGLLDQKVDLFARITEMKVCRDPWSRLEVALLMNADQPWPERS